MNQRVNKLRKQSLDTTPSISMERAELVTEAHSKHEGSVSTPVLRALTFKHLMENKKICINDGELIVGERGEAPGATPSYPELCCHTVEDLEITNKREKTAFAVSDRVKEVQKKKIIPYWKNRSLRSHIFNLMSKEWKDCYEAGIFTEFMEQRAPGHTVADEKIYKKGFLDFKQEIDQALSELDFYEDEEALNKQEELKAMKICIEAIIVYARRHAEKAEELARDEKDEKRKEELGEIAEVCRRVPANSPRSMHEALQMYWFVHIGVITELNTWDSFNPGRLDQHLYPFYKAELEKGAITKEQARELLQCFWVKFNNQPAPPKVGVTLKESGTYTDFANINIGGLTPEGRDGVNELSYMLLEVIDEMKLVQPSTNVQVSKKSPDLFLKKAIDVIRKGRGQPSVFNTDEVIAEMLRRGKKIEDARSGGTSGCVETGAFGKECYILTGYFNLTKILEITLNNGTDPATGKTIGLETGRPEDFKSYDELMSAYRQQLHYFVDVKIRGNNIIEKLYAENMPAPFLSTIISDCIQNGKDYNAGGARYNTRYIQGVGIGSITDSLSAIRYHVFDKNNLSLAELLKTLENNFSDSPETHALLKHDTPKYGNDNEYADQIMTSVFNSFFDAVDGRKTVTGGSYGINMLPTTCHIYFGAVTGATPDGRLAGKPLSEGISPVQGADRNGPTAVFKSASKMDHTKTGGTLLNQKFTPTLLEEEDGIISLTHLIRGYFKLGGHHVQFNVVNDKKLREAQKKPEKYASLIVRVAGYSDFFNHLDKNLQDEIIERTRQTGF